MRLQSEHCITLSDLNCVVDAHVNFSLKTCIRAVCVKESLGITTELHLLNFVYLGKGSWGVYFPTLYPTTTPPYTMQKEKK